MCIGSCVVSGAMMCGVCCASCGQGAVIEGGGKSWHHANHAIKDETCQRCHSSCLSVVAVVALIERKTFLDSLVSFKFFLFHGIFLCFCRALSHTKINSVQIAKKCYACPWYPSASCGMRAQSLGGPDPKARSCERCLCWSALVSKEPNHLSFQRYFLFFDFFSDWDMLKCFEILWCLSSESSGVSEFAELPRPPQNIFHVGYSWTEFGMLNCLLYAGLFISNHRFLFLRL